MAANTFFCHDCGKHRSVLLKVFLPGRRFPVCVPRALNARTAWRKFQTKYETKDAHGGSRTRKQEDRAQEGTYTLSRRHRNAP